MTLFHYSACPPATTTVSDVIRSGIGDKSELIKLQNKSHVKVVLHNTKMAPRKNLRQRHNLDDDGNKENETISS